MRYVDIGVDTKLASWRSQYELSTIQYCIGWSMENVTHDQKWLKKKHRGLHVFQNLLTHFNQGKDADGGHMQHLL